MLRVECMKCHCSTVVNLVHGIEVRLNECYRNKRGHFSQTLLVRIFYVGKGGIGKKLNTGIQMKKATQVFV